MIVSLVSVLGLFVGTACRETPQAWFRRVGMRIDPL